MQCFLSQYNNAMYVFGGDSSDVGSVYIYNFAADSWSKQPTTGAPAQLSNSRSAAVLDHDTNTIYTVAGGGQSMYGLALDSVTNTAGGSVAWEQIGTPAIDTEGPVTAALANNHINYFGVKGDQAGSASLFVIHFSYWQPQPQAYPTVDGGAAFPNSQGQAVSFPTAGNTSPQSMLYVPDDFSNSYVVTHWTNLGDYSSSAGAPMAANLINSTQILPAPTSKDKAAAYACSPSACAQIDSKGDIYYIDNALGSDFAVGSGAQWAKMGFSLTGTPSSGSSSGSTNSTDSTATATGTNTAAVGTPTGPSTVSGADAKTQAGSKTTGSQSGAGAATGTTEKEGASSKPSNGAATLNSSVFGLTLGALAVAAASLL